MLIVYLHVSYLVVDVEKCECMGTWKHESKMHLLWNAPERALCTEIFVSSLTLKQMLH